MQVVLVKNVRCRQPRAPRALVGTEPDRALHWGGFGPRQLGVKLQLWMKQRLVNPGLWVCAGSRELLSWDLVPEWSPRDEQQQRR